MKKFAAFLVSALVLGAIVNTARAAVMVGLTTAGRLVTFDTDTPGTLTGSATITGLQLGETLVGIDVRPATGQLYGVGSTSRVYTLSLATGAATAVDGPFSPALIGTAFGVDFNPVPDRIRVVSDADQNMRLNPITGLVAGTDTNLAYAAGDANAAANPNVVGVAYTNNFPGLVTVTTLYDIDSGLDILATQNPPNNGTLNTVGALGVNTSDLVGFDIASGDLAFASLTAGGISQLYRINLLTGAATLVGTIGGLNTEELIQDITFQTIVPEPSSLLLLGLGTLGLMGYSWRRRLAA